MNRLLPIAVLVSLALAACASATRTATSEQPATAALRICGNDPFPSRVADYGYVILNSWDWRRIKAIKARSPSTKVLVYKDMASTRDDAVHGGRDQAFLPSGVGYADASRHHPGWFLRDTHGSRVSWASWPHAWQMDVGNAGYERAWLGNVSRELRARGWDGVFVDGATAHPQASWALDGRVFAKYRTDAAYDRAATRFLRRVAPAIERRGRLVVANINDAELPLWRTWLRYLSGTSREWWAKSAMGPGEGLLGGAEWSGQLQRLRAAQALHKIFIAITYGTPSDQRSLLYARATFLLAENGPSSAFAYSSGCGTRAWSPSPAQQLGLPRGPAVSVGSIWRRDFSDGTVLVNPSDSTATLSLAGLLKTLAPRTATIVKKP
jgi:hypothetical protein